MLLLSDPEEFEGGHFVAGHGHLDLDLALPRYGGVLVRSDVPHGVTHVAKGRREVFAVEFWTHQEPGAAETRPDPVRVAPVDGDDGGGGAAGEL